MKLKHRRLARALAESPLSQNRWALRLGLDSGHLSKLVNGQRPYPGAETREKLLKGLGLSFDELFEVEHARPKRFGAAVAVASRSRRAGRMGDAVMTLLQDFRFAGRMMSKNPGFTLFALVIIALGVGANTALFSLVKGVLLGPLPFPEPGQLALLWSTQESRGELGSASYPDFLDWRRESRSFQKVAAFDETSFILSGRDGAERLPGEMVSADYFELLSVAPRIGRVFSEEEASAGAKERVVVLGERLLRTRYGGDPNVVGSTLRVNGETFTVIGVMPEGFRGFTGNASLWIPMGAFDVINPELARYHILDNRGTRWHRVVARLRADVEYERAQAELDRIAGALTEAYPQSNDDRGISLVPGSEEVVGEYRLSFLVLAAAVGLVLLIACANLANLFLGRALGRRREVAVRVALGATRLRLVRQFLSETLLFALAGGALGFLLARASAGVLLALAPVDLPSYITPSLDGTMLGFALMLSILTGALFGTLPAFAIARARPMELMKTGAQALRGRRSRFFLVVAEVSLAIVLLVGTGLVLKSLYRLRTVEPGFDTQSLLSFRLHLPAGQGEDEGATGTRLERLVEAIESLPGTSSASITSHVFYGQGYMSGNLTVEGYESRSSGEETQSYRQFVGAQYFEAMGIPLLRGRGFTSEDRSERPPVVVVDEAFAERFWPGEDPIGKRLVFGTPQPDKPWMTVVGVAANVRPRLRLGGSEIHESGMVHPGLMPQVYAPVLQGGDWARAAVVRTKLDPLAMVEPVRRAVRGLDPDIAVYSFASMEQLLADQRSDSRFLAFLMTFFAGLALLLAGVGIYGVVALSVRALQQEIGIRVALGAGRGNLLVLVMRRAVLVSAVGVGLGLVVSLGATRYLSSLLFRVEPLDLSVFLGVALVASLAVLSASLLPARRAVRSDPLTALRHE